MPHNLDCRYTGGDRSALRLFADLAQGWRELDGVWGYDGSGMLNYEITSKFHCRLRLEAAADAGELGIRPPYIESLRAKKLGCNLVSWSGSDFWIDVPLDQPWLAAEDDPASPSIRECLDFSLAFQSGAGAVSYRLELWVALCGPTRKFVARENDPEHESEGGPGSGFAWTGKVVPPAR